MQDSDSVTIQETGGCCPTYRTIKRNPWRKGSPPENVRTFVGFYGEGEVFKIADQNVLGKWYPCVTGSLDTLPIEVNLREPLAWRPA